MLKFQPITPKNLIVWLTSGAAIAAIALWSASMSKDVSVGKQTLTDGTPVITTVYRPNKNRFLFLSVSGGLAFATLMAFLIKEENGDRYIGMTDLSDSNKVLINNVTCALAFASGKGLRWLAGQQPTAKKLALSVLPVPIRDFVKESVSKKGWFKDFLAVLRHYIICGATGDGKTMLINAIVITYLENAQNNLTSAGTSKDLLAICDMNYGKCDANGEQNNWLGLPREYISVTADEIMAQLRSVAAELEKRRKEDSEHAPLKASDPTRYKQLRDAVKNSRGNILVVIEEFMNTRGLIKVVSPDLLKEFDAIVAKILRDGRGYLIKLLIVLQYLDGSKGDDGNGIGLGLRSQCAIVFLKTVAVQVDKVKSISNNAPELVQRFLEALKKCKYLAMVQIDGGEPTICEVEDLSWTSGVSVHTSADPIEEWWKEVWTEDNCQWIINCPNSPRSATVRAEFKRRFKIDVAAKDPRYQKLSAEIDKIRPKQLATTGA